MTDVEAVQDGQVLVRGAHRLIRMLDAQEGPYRGALVTSGDVVAVRTDAVSLGGWLGWEHAGAEHVAGPLDVVRRSDGQDVLLPWCPETVLAFLARRTSAGTPLSAGETTTLVGSLLRGLDELDGGCDVRGGWWLTDGGRPLFAIGEGGGARTAAESVVARLAESCQDRALSRTLGAVQQGLAQERTPRAVQEGWERELFELAAPQPLRREVFAPERVRDLALHRPAFDGGAEHADSRGWMGTLGGARQLMQHVAARLGALDGIRWPLRHPAAGNREAVADERGARRADGAGAPVRRRRERDGGAPARGRRLVIAGAAATAVLGIGLLWPSGSGEEAGAETGGTGVSRGPAAEGAGPERSIEGGEATTAPPSAEGGATRAPSADASDGEDRVDAPVDGRDAEETNSESRPSKEDADPVKALDALLSTIGGCRKSDDQVCADAVAPGSTGVIDSLAPVAGEKAALTLVDEYGDVAVIRLASESTTGAEAAGELMIVIVRLNDSWLVRDVYGVANQPG